VSKSDISESVRTHRACQTVDQAGSSWQWQVIPEQMCRRQNV